MSEVELGFPALAVLLLAGFASAVLTVFVLRRCSPKNTIRRQINRILAHLMEFQLFLDEPVVTLKAQRDLVLANLRLLRTMVRPSLILAFPFFLLFAALDRWCGHAAPPVDQPVVATLRLDSAAAAVKPWELQAPAGLRVETPGVHIVATHEVSWRVRPVAPSSGELRASAPEEPARAVLLPRPAARVFHQNWMVWYSLSFAVSTLAAGWSIRT